MQLNSEDHKAIFIAIREYESVTYLNTDKIKKFGDLHLDKTFKMPLDRSMTWELD